MATNEILDKLREHDKNEEIKELYHTLAQTFAEGSAQRKALEKLYKDKKDKEKKETRTTAEIKFNYVTYTIGQWTQQLRNKGILPVNGNHVKEMDHTMMMKIGRAHV